MPSGADYTVHTTDGQRQHPRLRWPGGRRPTPDNWHQARYWWSSRPPWLTPTGLELVRRAKADILVEASPTNIVDGEPGLSHIRTALERRMHVVSANKGPLVVAFAEGERLRAAVGPTLLDARHPLARVDGSDPPRIDEAKRTDRAPYVQIAQLVKLVNKASGAEQEALSRLAPDREGADVRRLSTPVTSPIHR